jgi:hypothetical protein
MVIQVVGREGFRIDALNLFEVFQRSMTVEMYEFGFIHARHGDCCGRCM